MIETARMAIAGPTDMSHARVVAIEDLISTAHRCIRQDLAVFGRAMLRDDDGIGVGLFAYFHHEDVQDDDPEWLSSHAVCWAPCGYLDLLKWFHPDGRIIIRARSNPIVPVAIAAAVLTLVAFAIAVMQHYTDFPN